MKLSGKYKVIGVMSGTSVDGLDMVYCEFVYKKSIWHFRVINSSLKRYREIWRKRLNQGILLSGIDLVKLDYDFGKFIGQACCDFIEENHIQDIDFIASHGHTLFHQPSKGLTYQLGNGGAIHVVTGIPVINDFRSLDVLRGGEGAPLVPIGDHLLFSEYDICLNIGGIANLSGMEKGKRIAYDICFANMGLNYLAAKINKVYDNKGQVASKGKTDARLLSALNRYYEKNRKQSLSLGREKFKANIRPLLDKEAIPLENRMRTFCDSICMEINNRIPSHRKAPTLLVTGGGALNDFLIHQLTVHLGSRVSLIVPDRTLINFKEAIIFGLLGVLRVRKEVNVLGDITGSNQNSSTGVMIGF